MAAPRLSHRLAPSLSTKGSIPIVGAVLGTSGNFTAGFAAEITSRNSKYFFVGRPDSSSAAS